MRARGVVIVTGGTRGIGAEIAVEAAQAGHDVIVGYMDPKKEKRAKIVTERIEHAGAAAMAFRGDLTVPGTIDELLHDAALFATRRHKNVAGLVLNAAGGLEQGGDESYAMQVNAVAPWALATKLIADQRMNGVTNRTDIVYVTSNPSHFYEDPENVMPSDVYDIVAKSKHAGEVALRTGLPHIAGLNHRLLVATADLVDDTAGATLLKMAHRRSAGNTGVDLLTARSAQLQELIGRGIPNAFEFGTSIVGMMEQEHLPSGHTMYLPAPVLGGSIVAPDDLPFGLGARGMHTFVQ